MLVKPLYVALDRVPGVQIGDVIANLDANLEQWKAVAAGAPLPPESQSFPTSPGGRGDGHGDGDATAN